MKIFSLRKEDIRHPKQQRFDQYKAIKPDAKPLKYGPGMKRQWRKTLNEVVIPCEDELR